MKVQHHRHLRVYHLAFELALTIHWRSLGFPKNENYALVDQIERSGRSVCTNLAEAFRLRHYYPKTFAAKLPVCEAETAETEVWLEFSVRLGCIDQKTFTDLTEKYDHVTAKLVNMIRNSSDWAILK